MTASVAAFLDKVRERGVELPPALTGALLLAAVRQSETRAIPIRPALLHVDAEGGLELREGAQDPDSPYASPELRTGAVLPNDPRAMVYAAGALGYELSTLKTLPPGEEAGPEIQGPLAPIIRKALAQDRLKRWRDLDQLARAIGLVQEAPTFEEERLILAAVAQTSGPQKKLARIELQKGPSPSPPDPPEVVPPSIVEPRVDTPPSVHPLFAKQWDPLEAPPEIFFQPPEGEEPGVVELHEAQAREARSGALVSEAAAAAPAPRRDELREDMVVLESRLENLARLGSRLSALEQQVKSSPPSAPVAPLPIRPPRSTLVPVLSAMGGAIVGVGATLLAIVVMRSPHPAPPAATAPRTPIETRAPLPEAPRPPPVPEVAPPPPVEPSPKPVMVQARADTETPPPAAAPPAPRKRVLRKSPAAADQAAQGDKALRAFNTAAAKTAFETALREDPSLPAAHRGLGMVYVLLGQNDAAKVEYEKYLRLAPDAPDADQIRRLLAR